MKNLHPLYFCTFYKCPLFESKLLHIIQPRCERIIVIWQICSHINTTKVMKDIHSFRNMVVNSAKTQDGYKLYVSCSVFAINYRCNFSIKALTCFITLKDK